MSQIVFRTNLDREIRRERDNMEYCYRINQIGAGDMHKQYKEWFEELKELRTKVAMYEHKNECEYCENENNELICHFCGEEKDFFEAKNK